MMRSTTLQKQGIGVMHLSTIQLYDKEIFADFAQDLARRLGKRIQIRTNKFDNMHEQLRTLLPGRGFANEPKGE